MDGARGRVVALLPPSGVPAIIHTGVSCAESLMFLSSRSWIQRKHHNTWQHHKTQTRDTSAAVAPKQLTAQGNRNRIITTYLFVINAKKSLCATITTARCRRVERSHNILLALTSAAMLVGIIRSCVSSGKTSSVHAMLCGAFDEEDPVFDVTAKTFFW